MYYPWHLYFYDPDRGADGSDVLQFFNDQIQNFSGFKLNSYFFLSDFVSQEWSRSPLPDSTLGDFFEKFRSGEGSNFSISGYRDDIGYDNGAIGNSLFSLSFNSSNFDKFKYKGTENDEWFGGIDPGASNGSTWGYSNRSSEALNWSYVGDKYTSADDTWMSASTSSKESHISAKTSDEYNIGTEQYKKYYALTESFTSSNYKLSFTYNFSDAYTGNSYINGDYTSGVTSNSFIQYKFQDFNSRFSLSFDKLVLNFNYITSATTLELRNFVASTDGFKIETTFFKGMLSIDQAEMFSDGSISLVPWDNFEEVKSSYYSFLEPITLTANNVITVTTTSGAIVDASTGNDKVIGNIGDDYLIGGAGKDTLIGGVGSDQFIFYAGDTAGSVSLADTIQDFKTLDGDLIDLSDIDSNINVVGNQAFANIAATIGSTAAAYSLWFNATSKILYGDTNGVTTTTEIAIKLVGATTLNLTDVIL